MNLQDTFIANSEDAIAAIGDVPGELIFAKVWGSHSHNMGMPTSDIDYLGVYVGSTKKVLGLDPPPETIARDKPDVQVHEVGKFAHLLMKGNPGIIECLFTDFMTHQSHPAWMEIKGHRKWFLSKRAVKQYLGYAEGQMKKFTKHGGDAGLHTKGGAYNEKWAYHMMRLLTDANRIVHELDPLVWYSNESNERKTLMSVRMGEWTRDQVERTVRRMIVAIEDAKPWPLPDEGDKEWLDDWLVRTRLAAL